MKWTRFVVVGVVGCAAFSCGGTSSEPAVAPARSTVGPAAPVSKESADAEKPGDDPAQSQINISDEIKKACGIQDTDAHFAFDSANIREQDARVLKQLANCFSSGALAGREMRLVGHADPRGEPEYNMVLGGKRAENVKQALGKQGLAESQVSTTSRGELDARGTDEDSWARDRRVDIVLAE